MKNKRNVLNIVILTIAAIITIILFLTLHHIICLKDSELANRFTIIGTIISFVGLLYAIYQLQKISSANKAAQQARIDTKHNFNFNDVVNRSSSIMELCRSTIQCINNKNYQNAADNIRKIRENIIYINDGIKIIKVREELSNLKGFEKYLTEIKISLIELQQDPIPRLNITGICEQLDNILIDATEISLIKNLL
ncbi:MAG TPA: hypothetical protein VIK14_06930 [Ignavibacteria bacterium]